MRVYVYVCVWVSVRDRLSAKSYNCGSVLQAQSPAPVPLIQHAHCTFSKSMIPLCLIHTLSLSSHWPICTYTLIQCTHTRIHFTFLVSLSPLLMRLCLQNTFSHIPLSLPFSFYRPYSLKPWTITHQDSREVKKREGATEEGRRDKKRKYRCKVRVNENCLSLSESLKTSAPQNICSVTWVKVSSRIVCV